MRHQKADRSDRSSSRNQGPSTSSRESSQSEGGYRNNSREFQDYGNSRVNSGQESYRNDDSYGEGRQFQRYSSSSRDSDYGYDGGRDDRYSTDQSRYLNNAQTHGRRSDYEDSRYYAGSRNEQDYDDRRDTSVNRENQRNRNSEFGGSTDRNSRASIGRNSQSRGYSQEANLDASESRDQWNPAYDLSESEEEYTMSWDVPGLQKDQFKLSLSGNRLSVAGERARGEGSSRSAGNRYGKFNRDFTLPDGIDSDKIDAHYQDGILNLRMPKSESAKARQLSIRGFDGSASDKSAAGNNSNASSQQQSGQSGGQGAGKGNAQKTQNTSPSSTQSQSH